MATLGSLSTACRDTLSYTDPPARFSLEVVNDSGERIRMQLAMIHTDFLYVQEDPNDELGTGTASSLDATPRHSCGLPSINLSPIIALDKDETITLAMKTYTSCGAGLPEGNATNVFVRLFRAIHFLNVIPVASYVYESHECIGFYCSRPGDDTLVVHESSDGTTEQLFLESPDRPFYLERDGDNRQLARVVITFVPNADETSGCRGFGWIEGNRRASRRASTLNARLFGHADHCW